MDFGLSEEQLLLTETTRSFFENECPLPRLHEIFDGDASYDPGLWKGMAEMGLTGIMIPEAYGGAELELLDLALTAEVIGHQAAPGPFLGHSLAGLAISLGGSDAQRKRWLPALASGDSVGTVAFAEATGWDPSEWQLTCSDGRLSGTKRFVEFGGDADLMVVGTVDGNLALVDRNSENLKATPVDSLDRTRRLWNLDFSATPCELLPNGSSAAPRVRDAGLCLLAGDALGGATRSIELATQYAKEREQFGVTIGHFQGVKHQLANLATMVEPTRGLFWYAAHAWDALPEKSERLAALAKSLLTDRFAQVARDAVELHGGIGFTWEEHVQIWLKRSVFDRAVLGTPVAHRERAARLAGWA